MPYTYCWPMILQGVLIILSPYYALRPSVFPLYCHNPLLRFLGYEFVYGIPMSSARTSWNLLVLLSMGWFACCYALPHGKACVRLRLSRKHSCLLFHTKPSQEGFGSTGFSGDKSIPVVVFWVTTMYISQIVMPWRKGTLPPWCKLAGIPCTLFLWLVTAL
jgi:hypothetical protein